MKTSNFSEVTEPQQQKQEPVWYKAGRIVAISMLFALTILIIKFCS